MASIFEVVSIGSVAVGIVGWGVHRWWNHPRQVTRRTLRSARSTPFHDVREGERVKVTGRVLRSDRALLAPVSKRSCVAWQVRVDELRHRGRSRHWETIIEEHDGVDFALDEGSAVARVEVGRSGHHAQLALGFDHHTRAGLMTDASEELRAFLQSRGFEATGMLGFNRSFRYSEGVIEEGERIAVLGVGRWEVDPSVQPSGGYREAGRRLIVGAPPGELLHVSDLADTTR